VSNERRLKTDLDEVREIRHKRYLKRIKEYQKRMKEENQT